jgi:hypothetical protein
MKQTAKITRARLPPAADNIANSKTLDAWVSTLNA